MSVRIQTIIDVKGANFDPDEMPTSRWFSLRADCDLAIQISNRLALTQPVASQRKYRPSAPDK
jgi:hypothetical protein